MGKSSIFLRYTKNQFDYSYQPSVSVSIGNVVKHVNIPYETIVSVALWDLPGREEMDLRRSYYKDVDAAIGENYSSKRTIGKCDLGSNPSVEAICGFSLLLVLSLTLRGLSLGNPVFPSLLKPTFPISKFGQEWYMKNHFVDVLLLNHHHCQVDVVRNL